jgi:hypothetical protein
MASSVCRLVDLLFKLGDPLLALWQPASELLADLWLFVIPPHLLVMAAQAILRNL